MAQDSTKRLNLALKCRGAAPHKLEREGGQCRLLPGFLPQREEQVAFGRCHIRGLKLSGISETAPIRGRDAHDESPGASLASSYRPKNHVFLLPNADLLVRKRLKSAQCAEPPPELTPNRRSADFRLFVRLGPAAETGRNEFKVEELSNHGSLS